MSDDIKINRIYNSYFLDAIDKIVVKLHGQKEKDGSRIFLFNGAGVKSGTTTAAKNVAVSLANAGWKTVFVDFDLRKGLNVLSYGEISLDGITDNEFPELKKIIGKTDVEGLEYIGLGNSVENPVKILCSDYVRNMFDSLRETYEYVIVDSTSVSKSNDAEILMQYVDKYLIVVSVNQTKKKEFAKARIQFSDFEDKYMGAVINNVELRGFLRENGQKNDNKTRKKPVKNQSGSGRKRGK